MKTLIEKLRQYATGDDFQRATEQAADAIERLELEAVAATLRIENDKLEIAKLWATNERLAFSVTAANAQTEEFERKWYLVSDERDALKLDAGRYKWLQENHKSWSWNPSQYAAETTSGFAAFDTGYLVYGFTDAVDAAMGGME